MTRPLAFFLLLLLCAMPVLAQPNFNEPAPPPKADPRVLAAILSQQIEATIREFVRALNGNNVYFEALNGVADVRDVGYFGGPEWATGWQQRRGTLRLEIEKITLGERKEDMASAQVSYFWSNRALRVRTQTITEGLNLKQGKPFGSGATQWQIVPPQTLEEAKPLGIVAPVIGEDGFVVDADNAPVLNDCAAKIATPKGPWIFGDFISPKETVFNLKQLANSTFQFTQDYDEKYAFAAQFYKEALTPYSQKQEIWTIPATGEPYTFNGNLSGLSSIATPDEIEAKLVMFYEGQNEKPVFRYKGRAAICFADGNVALVTPEEAKNLVWKP